ncbi:MAG: hypothetical protein ACYTBJ_26330 [Planctomycetota bacterium]|jgi:hypothetical protein
MVRRTSRKPYYNLWLLTGVLPPVSLLPNWLTASEIEKDQMVRIIDRLAKKGFFVDPRPVEAKGPARHTRCGCNMKRVITKVLSAGGRRC